MYGLRIRRRHPDKIDTTCNVYKFAHIPGAKLRDATATVKQSHWKKWFLVDFYLKRRPQGNVFSLLLLIINPNPGQGICYINKNQVKM